MRTSTSLALALAAIAAPTFAAPAQSSDDSGAFLKNMNVDKIPVPIAPGTHFFGRDVHADASGAFTLPKPIDRTPTNLRTRALIKSVKGLPKPLVPSTFFMPVRNRDVARSSGDDLSSIIHKLGIPPHRRSAIEDLSPFRIGILKQPRTVVDDLSPFHIGIPKQSRSEEDLEARRFGMQGGMGSSRFRVAREDLPRAL